MCKNLEKEHTMNTLSNFKLMLLAAVFFMTTDHVYSYPPDNAAVLYYQAALLYQPDDQMKNMVGDFASNDNAEPNDRIKEFVKKNRKIIATMLDASAVKNCDWGMDFSQGITMEIPYLNNMRKLAYLVVADAKILAKDGDYEAAISRCMALYKMARHTNERNYVCYLVSISINGLANRCITQILGDMPQDTQSLTNLKNKLIEIESIPLSVKPAILGEREAVLGWMTKEQLPDVVKLCEINEPVKGKILSLDEAALERSRKYFENYYAGTIAAFDMPYVQGYAAFNGLQEKLKTDVNNNSDAFLTNELMPAVQKIFSLATRYKTHNNVIMAAIELYMIKAKTGKLPDVLPAGLPGDLFSDKPFIYEKTPEGFTLRCQGKELSKDEPPYEYKFKVK
jgi:hypothetical protein